MKTLSAAMLIALLASCGGGKASTKTDTTAATAPGGAKAGAMLGIADLKFYEGDKLGAHLLADGSFQVEQGGQWTTVGTITADGKIIGKDGKGGQLQPDGTLKATDPKVQDDPGFKLDADTLVVQGEKGEPHRVTLDDKGMVVIDGKPEPSDKRALRVVGATDVGTRRTALLVIGMMVTPSKSPQESVSGPPTTTVPTPPIKP